MNGDSFIEIRPLPKLIRFHLNWRLASMAVVRKQNERRYGTVQMDAGGAYWLCRKNGGDGGGFVNAGVYVFNRAGGIFGLSGKTSSLEKDIFPKLVDHGLYASRAGWSFIDIGTPERLRAAQELCDRLYAAASRRLPLGDSE